ncbi:alpha/beta hydrolase, partial [Candidatus Dojkabacteria bacterium]|nr:alpha/beta hydrolase [Candidatus Dojkabacteria bacterium]
MSKTQKQYQKNNFILHNAQAKNTPIIILHGWGGSLHSLTPLGESLSSICDHPIYVLELPGFGKTRMPHQTLTTSDYANFVLEFITEKKLETPIIIGHSFGGKILLDITSKNKYALERIILINPSGIKPRNSLKKSVSKLLKKITTKKKANNKVAKNLFYKYILRERDYLNAGSLKKTLSTVVNEHYDEYVSSISIPTLIIWGENDSYVPLWM